MKRRRNPIKLILLLPVLFSCRPVIAIGWDEFLVLLVFFIVLFGLPLFRLLRQFDDFRKSQNSGKKKK
jgi:hypothetical protein